MGLESTEMFVKTVTQLKHEARKRRGSKWETYIKQTVQARFAIKPILELSFPI